MIRVILDNILIIKRFMFSSENKNTPLIRALQCAIESMELRVPEKVKHKSDMTLHYGYFCPKCEMSIEDSDKKPNFCQVCGKALDWEDEVDTGYTD